MTEDKIHKINYTLNQLGKRILPQYFYEMSPDKMNQWQNQICRQSHVIAAHFLNRWLNTPVQNYEIKFYESKFFDPVLSMEYDHSWLWIRSWNGPRETFICDIARVAQHIGFVSSDMNTPETFLKGDKEVPGERKSFEWQKLLQEKEYYTGLTGLFIVSAIETRMRNCKLNF